jgi:hypothetical protein
MRRVLLIYRMFLKYTIIALGACSVYKNSETRYVYTCPWKLHFCSMSHSTELLRRCLVCIPSVQVSLPPQHTLLSCLSIMLLSIQCDVTVFLSDSNRHCVLNMVGEYTLAKLAGVNLIGH